MRVLLAGIAGSIGRKVAAPLPEHCQKQTKELYDFVQRYFRVSKVYGSSFLGTQQAMVSLVNASVLTAKEPTECDPSEKTVKSTHVSLRRKDDETSQEVLDRTLKVLSGIIKVPDDTGIPMIVSHGNVLSQLLGKLSGGSFIISHPDLYMVTFHKEQAAQVQRIWSDSGPLIASDRFSARAILLNPKRDAIYMFDLIDTHMVTSSIVEHRSWFTPGGGMNSDEDLHAVLERELWEELSLNPTKFRVLGHLWTGRTSMIWKGLPHTFIDNYFLVELTSEMDVFGRGNLMKDEIEVLRSGRWWPLEELAVTKEKIVPNQLRTLCKMDLSNFPYHSNIGESV